MNKKNTAESSVFKIKAIFPLDQNDGWMDGWMEMEQVSF